MVKVQRFITSAGHGARDFPQVLAPFPALFSKYYYHLNVFQFLSPVQLTP